MALTCRLSPLVFAELYRLLSDTPELKDAIRERLDLLGYSPDWLTDATSSYDAKWRADLAFVSPADVDSFALTPEHALMASWVLAGLRHKGHCFDLSDALARRVLERVIGEFPEMRRPLPASLSPSILAWTLGSVVGRIDNSLPLVPAKLPDDEHVSLAYQGLVDHVLYLNDDGEPWPELIGTATFVRGAGLAEALQPEQKGPGNAINSLMAETNRQVPSYVAERLRRHWIGWVERRNALTHVKPEAGRPTFLETAGAARTWDQIRLTVLGVTHFVCQQVAQELRDTLPPALRADPWTSFLQRELQTEW